MRTAAKTAALMAVLTLGTKVLGFLREVLLAGFFGTSYIVDAYVMASAIPGILFASVFTSVAVSYLPIFSRIVQENGIEEGNRFTSEAINLATFIAIIASGVGIVFARPIVGLLARGYKGDTAELTIFYLRITFVYLIFIAATSLLESYLQYKGTFLKPILAGYLHSGAVLAVIVVSAYTSYYYMAVGIIIGSVARLVALIFFARGKKFKYHLSAKISRAAKEIMVLALPVFIGSMVNQVNSFVDKMLASGLVEGSVSALNYGNLLTNMITAMTITVIMTIIYPKLTRSIAGKNYDGFNDSISKGMNIILIISLPCSLGAMLYSNPVVSLVYERGAFDGASTDLTSGAFFYYSIGLTFVAINALLVKAFYAMEDMKTPVVCGVIGAGSNIILNLLLLGPMAHRGLALATSVAAMLNASMLYYLMRRKYPNVQIIKDKQGVWKIGLSAVVSVFVSWLVFIGLHDNLGLARIISLGLAVICAVLIYLVFLRLYRIEELSMLKDLYK